MTESLVGRVVLVRHALDMSTPEESQHYTLVNVLAETPQNVTHWEHIAGDSFYARRFDKRKIVRIDATQHDLDLALSVRNSLRRTIIENREHAREQIESLRNY